MHNLRLSKKKMVTLIAAFLCAATMALASAFPAAAVSSSGFWRYGTGHFDHYYVFGDYSVTSTVSDISLTTSAGVFRTTCTAVQEGTKTNSHTVGVLSACHSRVTGVSEMGKDWVSYNAR